MTNPIVTISDGQLKGKISQNYLGGQFYSFLGIPYGKPPVGELRFKAPLPTEPWTGVWDATKDGPECPSLHTYFQYYVGCEEKCLHLNVYTRELPSQKSECKPVMVWIHGGAFVNGSNKKELFGPDYLMTEDIVLVVINYRLGAFGFLSLEDASLEVPGNAGLKDMILALKWVQKNIVKFNGDHQNVTIFGESAGSASVHYLYLSPLSKGLFHKVIAQSGCALNVWAKGRSNGRILAKCLKYDETDEKHILQYLKKLPARTIVTAQHKIVDTFNPKNVRPFVPVVENSTNQSAFLTEAPTDILKSGRFHHVPIIMGYNSKEGILYEAAKKIMLGGVNVPIDFEAEIPYDLNLEEGTEESVLVARKIRKFYFNDQEPSQSNLDCTYLMKTDNYFVHGIYKSLEFQKKYSTAPIYFYRMSLDTSLNFFKIICTAKSISLVLALYLLALKAGKGLARKYFITLAKKVPRATAIGTCHADDLSYIFKGFQNENLKTPSTEEISVQRFIKLWTNFAKTGNPTPQVDNLLNNIIWKPVTKTENHFLEIGEELSLGINPDEERMKFWDSIYEK